MREVNGIAIGKGTPPRVKLHGNEKWPWAELEVNEFFDRPYKPGLNASDANKRHAPKRFTTERVGDNLRTWRVA